MIRLLGGIPRRDPNPTSLFRAHIVRISGLHTQVAPTKPLYTSPSQGDFGNPCRAQSTAVGSASTTTTKSRGPQDQTNTRILHHGSKAQEQTDSRIVCKILTFICSLGPLKRVPCLKGILNDLGLSHEQA